MNNLSIFLSFLFITLLTPGLSGQNDALQQDMQSEVARELATAGVSITENILGQSTAFLQSPFFVFSLTGFFLIVVLLVLGHRFSGPEIVDQPAGEYPVADTDHGHGRERNMGRSGHLHQPGRLRPPISLSLLEMDPKVGPK